MDHVQMVVAGVALPEGDFGWMFLNDVPSDSILTKFTREELIEQNNETFTHVAVVEIFVTV